MFYSSCWDRQGILCSDWRQLLSWVLQGEVQQLGESGIQLCLKTCGSHDRSIQSRQWEFGWWWSWYLVARTLIKKLLVFVVGKSRRVLRIKIRYSIPTADFGLDEWRLGDNASRYWALNIFIGLSEAHMGCSMLSMGYSRISHITSMDNVIVHSKESVCQRIRAVPLYSGLFHMIFYLIKYILYWWYWELL